MAAGGSAIRRSFVTGEGREFEAAVYGRRVSQRTTENAFVHGVAIDGVLAVSDEPLRLMEPGERVSPERRVSSNLSGERERNGHAGGDRTRCACGWKPGGEIYILCNGGHIPAFREQLIAAEGGTGGASKPSGSVPSSWTTGVKSVLYIRVTFPDQQTDPQPEKEAYDVMKSVNDFFVENSHGALHLMTTVTPLLMMPRPQSWYKANDNSSANMVLSDARAVARAAGYDNDSYDLDAVRYSGASGSFNGQAYIGGRGCWLRRRQRRHRLS
jgi:hypothetical protein